MEDREQYLVDLELRKNGEGYPDPTAYEAIRRAELDLEYERHRKVVGCLLRVCELAGYSIEERIILRDNRTGKIWR